MGSIIIVEGTGSSLESRRNRNRRILLPSGTGSPGASAYQVAVSNGFVGTESEWLDSLVPTAQIDAAVDAAVESHTPGIELGYASRVTSFTTTNTVFTNAAGDIPAMAVTIIGAGRPVDLRFHAPIAYHSVANTLVHGLIVTNGASNTVNNQIGGTFSPSTTSGPSLIITRRTAVLTTGVSYTFGVRIWGVVAGTTTLTGAGSFPIELVATSR